MIGREKPGEQSEVAQLIQQTLEQERWQREMMEQRYNQYMDEQEVSLYAQGSFLKPFETRSTGVGSSVS